MADKNISIVVNGMHYEVKPAYQDWTLVRYLREILKLTGTKQGCDNEGTCGLCKVIIDGKARQSCKMKMSKLDGAKIETIESLALDGKMPHPLIQTVIQDGIFSMRFLRARSVNVCQGTAGPKFIAN